jgi:hypothetical protein
LRHCECFPDHVDHQDVAWGKFEFVRDPASDDLVEVPSGPLCLKCDEVKPGWPHLTVEQFIAAHRESAAMRADVKRAKAVKAGLADSDLKRPSAVTGSSRMGSYIRSELDAYTPQEFAEEFGNKHDEMKCPTVQHPNEDGVMETFVLVGPARPGTLVLFSELSTDLAETLMKCELRDGHGPDLYTNVVKSDVVTRSSCLQAQGRMNIRKHTALKAEQVEKEAARLKGEAGGQSHGGLPLGSLFPTTLHVRVSFVVTPGTRRCYCSMIVRMKHMPVCCFVRSPL